MQIKIFRSFSEPIRSGLSVDQLWNAEDKGLIKSWEVGRVLRDENPELAERVECGELPVLHWRGGVAAKAPDETVEESNEASKKLRKKYGTFFYLAELQGLRGEHLDVDTTTAPKLICSRSKVMVIFTSDLAQLEKKP